MPATNGSRPEEDVLGRLFAQRCELPASGETFDAKRLPAHGGVYALTDDEGRLIQTIATESLRRSAGTRLARQQEGRSRRRADVRAVARWLWWQPTWSAFETSLRYLNVARQLLGRDYRKELAFGPVWTAWIDPGAAFPRWVVSAEAFGLEGVATGPFATRKHAARFVEMLEDTFDLCRYPHILEQAPHGQACAYFEMGKCPAPCDGTISMEEYRQAVHASVEAATGDWRGHVERLESEMKSSAGRLDFEAAQRLRDKAETIAKANELEGRLARRPDELRVLIVQRASRGSTVKPYFLSGGTIKEGEEVRAATIDRVAADWAQFKKPSDNGIESEARYRTECLWLVSHFLIKNGPGVFLQGEDARRPATIELNVRARFVRPRRRQSPPIDAETVDPP